MGKKATTPAAVAAEPDAATTEAAEVIEQAAEVIEQAAEPVLAAPAKPDPYEMVDMYAPPPTSDNEDANIVIYINGNNWVIPKNGEYHKVPRYVRDEYERSQRAIIAARNNKNKRAQREKDINARAAALIGGGNI